MRKLDIKYGLDDKLPIGKLIIFGFQWLVITIPTLIIIGKVVAGLHFSNPIDQIIYLQKLSFLVGVSLLIQVLWGHRLPLVIGPAAVLLVGIVGARGTDIHTVYTSIFVGGITLFLLGITGLFGRLIKLFTPHVVATILILIAFTLTPTILNLIVNPLVQSPILNICFALLLVLVAFAANRRLPGFWRSTLIIWLMILGSVAYFLISPNDFYLAKGSNLNAFSLSFFRLDYKFSIDPGILTSFLLCFLALSINDIGSIQSTGEMIKPANMKERLTRGISFTGLANTLSGLFGVIGLVNFSLSPGVIASTGCASRFTLVPAAFGLIILSCLPAAIGFMGSIPSVVIGSVLLYIMSSQIAAGLMVAIGGTNGFKFESGLIIGLPLMLGIIISFLPPDIIATFPAALRPILGNGFVMGVLSVLVLEHIIFRH